MKINYTPISRLLTASVMLFMVSALTLLGQTPGTFNYQAVLRDAGGDIRPGANVAIELEIHQATSTGTIVYSEIHNTTTNGFGLVNLKIGSVSPGSFATIDWSAGPYYVEVSVDGTSMGVSQLLTVPYALHASFAESTEISGSEAAFAAWDKNEADDFDGAFGSLNGIPAGLADGDDNTQLNEAQVEAFINGNEASFNAWDKNAADDFDGAFGSLAGIPAGLSDGDDNTQLNEAQVEAFINGDEAAFSGWDKNAADDISVSGPQEGDIVYYSSGNWVRLPRGADGEVLLLDGGLPTWELNGTNVVQTWFQFVTYYSSTTPIAFGFINTDASINAGSGNFTCTWNATYDRYEISITGYSYYYNNYTTLVTLCGGDGNGASVTTSSAGGDLLIYIRR